MKKVRNLFTGRQESKQMLRGARSHNGEFICASVLFVSTCWVMYICAVSPNPLLLAYTKHVKFNLTYTECL